MPHSRRTFITGLTATATGILSLPAWAGPRPRAALWAKTGRVAGTVTIRKGRAVERDRSDVILYLEGRPVDLPNTANRVHEIQQVGHRFVPKVSAVVVGTTLSFPNEDKEFHNVFSQSETLVFDLGLYQRGGAPTVVTKRPGIIDVRCNVHPMMEAQIVVLETPHYTQSGADGTFEIRGVPPGTWTLVAWHARCHPWSAKVVVPSSGRAEVTVELDKQRGRQRHLRKDGTPYPDY